MRFKALAILAIVVSAEVARAQETPLDWDIARDPGRRMVTAAIPVTTGLGLVVRCSRGSYEALIMGLPPQDGDNRRLDVAFGDENLHPETWNVSVDPTIAVSSLPAPFARQLRQGGRMQIRVPNATPDGRAMRHVLDLPPSASAIDETLTACDRPLEDPRDALIEDVGPGGLPAGLTWAEQPRLRYPIGSPYTRAFVVLSCLTTREGALEQCVVEAEHPTGGYFGEAALRGASRARLQVAGAPDQPLPIRRIIYRTNFQMARR